MIKIFALALSLLTLSAFARPCKIYMGMNSWETTEYYAKKLSKVGHQISYGEAGADFFVEDILKVTQDDGVLFFKGKGKEYNFSINLVNREGQTVAKSVYSSCHVSERMKSERVSCTYFGDFNRIKANHTKKMLKDIACE